MRRWLAFNVVGIAGLAVQLAVLAVLTHHAGMGVAFATLIAVEAAILHNFCWHQRWTWKDRGSSGPDGSLARLGRFHAANGVVSLAGNTLLTTWLTHTAGVDAVAANVVAVAACSLVNYVAGDRLVFRAAAVLILALTPSAALAEQSGAATRAWDRYVVSVEQRFNAPAGSFFALDNQKVDRWRNRARAGEVPMTEIEPPSTPDARVHHWAGAIFIPRASVDEVVRRLQEYAGRESEFYEEVKASKLLSRNGDTVRVFLRLYRDAGPVEATYNTEHQAEYRRIGGSRAVSRSVSTKIAELADAGTPTEHEKPAGSDRGFLWRLNAYWRYEQVDGGVLIECESVSLSRNVPFLIRPIASPIVDRIARESLARTLRSLRAFLVRSTGNPSGK